MLRSPRSARTIDFEIREESNEDSSSLKDIANETKDRASNSFIGESLNVDALSGIDEGDKSNKDGNPSRFITKSDFDMDWSIDESLNSFGRSFNSKFRSKSGRSDTTNPLEILKELKELKCFNIQYQSKIHETEGSKAGNSVVISDLNDQNKSFSKFSNFSPESSTGPMKLDGLSMLERELKEKEVGIMQENNEVREMLKQINPEWYNKNNESTTSECFQEAMLMYNKDFKKMKGDYKNNKSSKTNGKENIKSRYEKEETKSKTSTSSKQKYLAKMNDKVMKMEVKARKKFENKFIEYQLHKRKQVSNLEKEVKALKEQMMKQNQGFQLNDLFDMSLDRIIKAAFLTLIVVLVFHFAHLI